MLLRLASLRAANAIRAAVDSRSVGWRGWVRATPEPPSIRVEPSRSQAPSTVYAHGVRHA